MKGGAIIGEGAEGCVYAQPLWPCAAGRPQTGDIPAGSDPSVVAKLVEKHDIEHVYLEAARDILGPRDSMIYLAGIRGMCSPANSKHPPSQEKLGDFKESVDETMVRPESGMACSSVKKDFAKRGLTDQYNLMFISRYPSTLEQWIDTIEKKRIPTQFVLKAINTAVRPFLAILQKFYKNSNAELINMDLHHKNIFVRANGSHLQFGMSDFGQCYFRRSNNAAESRQYFLDYLKRFFTVSAAMYAGYRQIPFETRLMDFCFKKRLENVDPLTLINAFIHDREVREYQATSNDIIAINLDLYCKYLLTRPEFIQSIELIQSICKKIKMIQVGANVEFNSADELMYLNFCITRFMAISPLVTILEQTMFLSESLYDQVKQVSDDYFSNGNSKEGQIYNLTQYINRMIIAPYSGSIQGSSFKDVLASVISVDLVSVWDEV